MRIENMECLFSKYFSVGTSKRVFSFSKAQNNWHVCLHFLFHKWKLLEIYYFPPDVWCKHSAWYIYSIYNTFCFLHHLTTKSLFANSPSVTILLKLVSTYTHTTVSDLNHVRSCCSLFPQHTPYTCCFGWSKLMFPRKRMKRSNGDLFQGEDKGCSAGFSRGLLKSGSEEIKRVSKSSTIIY